MKKIIAIILSALMLANISACAFAADAADDAWKKNTGTINLDTMTVTGEGVSVDGSVISITAGGDFEVTGTLADGMIYVLSDSRVKLRLSGASIINTTGPAIFFDDVDKGFITITENTENYLADGKEYTTEDADAALFSNDDLEIKGSGTLNIEGNYKHGIAGDDDVSIENGTINIHSYEHGVKANDKLSVSGGTITVTSETGKGMKAGLEVNIEGGDITINSLESEGIESKGTLTISGGNINITAADDGINTGNADGSANMPAPDRNGRPDGEINENGMPAPPDGQGGNMPMSGGPNGNMGMRGDRMQNGGRQRDFGQNQPMDGAQPPQMPEGFGGFDGNGQPPQMPEGFDGFDGNGQPPQMPEGFEDGFNGGRGGFGGGGFGMIDEETAAAHAITITGGTIYIKAGGDGIDSNGSLAISGGEIIVDGPVSNGDGPLDSEGTMSITGGTVILASSAGMLQLPRDGQNIISVIFSEWQSAGTEITVRETKTGNEIAAHTPGTSFQAFVLSTDKITVGTEYTIYINGAEHETVTATEGTTSVGSMNMFGGRGDRDTSGGRNNRIRVTVNGKDVQFNTDPVIKNDTTLVGFRAILEALGASVDWDGKTQTVTAQKDGTTIILNIGSTKAYVNGGEKTLLLAPEIINDSTMIPVRFVSEELNMNVDWNGDTQMIDITSK